MAKNEENLDRLIEQARAKDEQACQKILNLYKGRVFSYVMRMVRNYHDAEDITFDTFIKCFRSLHKYDMARRFTTWLFAILLKNKQAYEYFDERHAGQDDFVKAIEQKKKMARIEQAMDQLAAIDREIVVLFHKEEYSYQEISEITGLPITTIKTRLHRARKKLSRIVREKT
jgi:RNA polymerase sigma-70 factor (ECF subfamily)